MERQSCPDAEDFLFDSLQTLYDYHPITLANSGKEFTYTSKSCPRKHEHTVQCGSPLNITLTTPDTDAANWALQASSIWVSSLYLSDRLGELNLEEHFLSESKSSGGNHILRVLELGASAGLPSILIAKLYSNQPVFDIKVTASDFPDEVLIKTLSENVIYNGVEEWCRVIPYAWGTDPAQLLEGNRDGFDIVIAADTLWNPECHDIFIQSLKATLRKSFHSRIYIVVGLHTGRYTIQSFITKALKSGFDLERLVESQSIGYSERVWEVERAGEDENERRRWVVWIQLKWTKIAI